MVIDRDRKIVAWNKAMEQISGLPKQDVIGKGDFEYAIPFYGERGPILIDVLQLSDTELASRYSSVHREGNCLFAEVFVPKIRGGAHLLGSAALLHDQDGNIIGAIAATGLYNNDFSLTDSGIILTSILILFKNPQIIHPIF